MLTNERHDKIFSYLKKNHRATVLELSQKLYVSTATIRRDLDEMQKMGLLERSHGGAVLLEEADEISIFVRINENAKQKEHAAFNALKALPSDFKTVFVDSSSTALALAQRMNLAHKTVITNNLQTALVLSRLENVDLIIPGGKISSVGNSVVGSWADTLLSEFRFDLMISSCAAIDDGNAYEFSLNQREIKRVAFQRSTYKILVCDHNKLHKTAAYLYQPLSAFNCVVFDELTDEERISLQKANAPVL